MDIRRNQHSVYALLYHAVFVIKYRREVIDSDILELMKSVSARLLKQAGGELIGFYGEPDHVHIIFELPPQTAPAIMVNVLKTQLSRQARAYQERFKDKLWENVFWSDSYFLSTAEGASMDAIEAYIQAQSSPQPRRKYVKSGKYKKSKT